MVKTIFSPRVKNIPPQWLSKCSQWTSRISITWELVKILRSIKHKKKTKKKTKKKPWVWSPVICIATVLQVSLTENHCIRSLAIMKHAYLKQY